MLGNTLLVRRVELISLSIKSSETINAHYKDKWLKYQKITFSNNYYQNLCKSHKKLAYKIHPTCSEERLKSYFENIMA